MELTGTQKNKWLKLKAEIIKRPFLAFIAQLSFDEINAFLQNEFPTAERLEEINKLLLSDREKKTERLQPLLLKKVGHRGSVKLANKLGVSDTTIKKIIDKKSTAPPSYDLLGNIEMYLFYTSDYKLSIEHLNVSKDYVGNKVSQAKGDIEKIICTLRWIVEFADELKEADKKVKHYFGEKKPNTWIIEQIQTKIDTSIEELKNIKSDIETLAEDFINKNDRPTNR